VHFYEDEDAEIPSEMEANWKSKNVVVSAPFFRLSPPAVLDEAFPEITIDLVRDRCISPRGTLIRMLTRHQILVQAPFGPDTLAALVNRLNIPPSLLFMSCPGPHFLHSVADLGTRVISL
jgi:hypothetical protein